MAEFGTLTLQALLLLSTWSGALALVGARRRSSRLIHAARKVLYSAALMSSVSIVVLGYAFAVSDFSITYVQRYSDRSMPAFYKLTAIWGGQEGSLLLWVWLLAVLSAWAVHANQERLRELIPYVVLVLTLALDFFCLLLLLSGNPFESFLVEIPGAGRGLNPLLQNAYMVTHPPALYVGYVGMTIPFAFAMAALIAGQTDESWIQAARPWALASWYCLSAGLVLGMLWAYEELGWGGYWAWDPVENAGLIPWLTATAYIHSVMVQERRQMLKVWNVLLAVLTFELTIFGTFLTRSGFIQSVHAFARSDIGWYFLGFMVLVALLAGGLMIWRWPLLRSRGELESVVSREFSVVINNWVLLSAAFLVLVLTIFPSLSQLFGDKVTISAPAFNRWMVPIGLALLVLTGLGPMLGWRMTTRVGLRRQFLAPGVVGLAVAFGLSALNREHPLALATFGLCAFVGATVVQELVRGTRARMSRLGVDVLAALVGLIGRNRRRYGGYLVHLGVVLMYLGFAGEAYKEEAEVSMRRGERIQVGRYILRFDGVQDSSDHQKRMLTASLSVYETDAGTGASPDNGAAAGAAESQRVGVVHPARWIYFKHQGQPTSEVDILRSALHDLFVVLGDYDAKAQTAAIKVVVNPLVNWIWIGFVLLSLGTAIALLPVAAGRLRGAAGVTTALVLSLLLVGATAGVASAEPAAATSTSPPSAQRNTEAEQRLFSSLACMCPNCPRIPLGTCQCGFASKERTAIRGKIALGWSEQRILSWYLERRGPELGRDAFGQVALTTPPDTGINRLSWLLPYTASGLAVAFLLLAGRRWVRSGQRTRAAETRAASDGVPDGPLAGSEEEQQAAYERLLERELKKLD
jgi:cytochrome c-type biogenesis protein CcmF